jgi:hypothetical protein
VYIEPDDLMLSRDSSMSLPKPRVSDLADQLSKKAEVAALGSAPPKLSPTEKEIIDDNARKDSIKPGHDEGLIPGKGGPGKTQEDFKDYKPFESAQHTEHVTLDDKGEAEVTDKKKEYVKPQAKPKASKEDITGDVKNEDTESSGATQNTPGSSIDDKKKKKKIKRTKGDGSTEEIEVEADYKLGEGEELIE